MSEIAAPFVARVLHNAGTHVTALVNDVPIYQGAVQDFVAPSFPGCPWLMPGENSVVLEVEEAPINPEVPVRAMFELCFFLETEKVGEEHKDFVARYPECMEGLPPERQKFPQRSNPMLWTPAGVIPEPIWKNSPPGNIPVDGTPELLQAVHQLHEAFETRNVDAFLDATSTKIADLVRYTGPQPHGTRAELAKETEENFAFPWDLRPFDPKKLRFRSCCDGRVAFVTDDERGPALSAQHKTEPGTKWRPKLYLFRDGGAWRIFR